MPQKRVPRTSLILVGGAPLLLSLLAGPARAQSSGSSASPAVQNSRTPPAPAMQDTSANSGAELSSRDLQPSFKVRVNLVQVRVVVRDEKGHVVPNLRREDFQLFDNRKPQAISLFNMETRESRAMKNVNTTGAVSPLDPSATAPVNLPQRFVAMVFDDIHMSLDDAAFVRSAATKFFSSLDSTDRAGMFSSSGQITLDFTADKAALDRALLKVIPHPLSPEGLNECPEISYYQADLMENKRDPQAIAVATEDAVQCAFNGDERQQTAARALADSMAMKALSVGDAESEMTYRHLEDVIRRLAAMPGQRVLVLISPGFIPTTLWIEVSDLIDRATRAGVVINTIDARGLYTPDMGDISNPRVNSQRTIGYKASYRVAAQSAQDEVLAAFADGTGGTFFHNRNDIDEGMRQAGASPEISYVLGFSPQNLKIDGKFHTLKVSLVGKQKYSVQARRGYYAPRTAKDPAETARQEIQEAIFSQEEIRDLPVDLQTQFFKTDATAAKLAVLTHFDVKGIPFRKAGGRNLDNVTIATAIFDENGNLVTGGEKIVEMKLLDSTYNRLSRNGFTVKSSFDVKPGSYLVRMVVRDAEGAEMAARNGAVVIPY